MRRWRGLSLLLFLLLAGACSEGEEEAAAGSGEAAAVVVAGVAVPAVAHPDLAGVEEGARRQLEDQRRALSAVLGRSRPEPVAAAEALGEMGRLYHAYWLHRPAVACYAGAAALAAGDDRWPYLLGLLHQQRGEMAAAAAGFREALERRPGDGAALVRLGEILLAQNRPREARAMFEGALAAPGFAPAARFGLGRAAAEAGDPAAAVEHFQAVLAARPEAGRVHYPLALAYRRLGLEDEARRFLALPSTGEVGFPDPLAEALSQLAAGASAQMHHGGAALMAGDLEAAEEAYQAAVAADPASAEARRNLALVLARRGEHVEAARQLEQALVREPGSFWLHFDHGTALLGSGDPEAAVEAFRRAVELAPDFTSARFNLANTLIRLGRWQEAAGHLERIVAGEPGHANARYLLAMAVLQQGRSAEAERRLRALVAEQPRHAAARQGLGQALMARGDAAGARRLFEEALALEPPPAEAAAAHRVLGQLAVRRGRYREAAGHLAEAVRLAPEDTAARLAQAVALSAAGRAREARLRLEEAREALPDDPSLAHALARLLATAPDAAVRDGVRALELAREAHRSYPSLEHAATVAMALAAAGDFQAAVRWQQGLLQQVETAGVAAPAAVERLRRDLALYQRGEGIRRPLS